MGLSSLFNTLRRQQQHQSNFKRSLRRLPQKRTLRLEPLEDRRLLSAGGVETAEQAMEVFGISPALFVENQGQWEDASVQYAFFGDGANVLHTDTGPVFQLFRREAIEETDPTDDPFEAQALWEEPAQVVTEQAQFSVCFDGALAVDPIGLDQSEAVHNYIIGDQVNWRSGVPTFETVGYEGLYEGIDLYTWGRRDSLKYEFHVAPGSDYRQIQVSYDGVDGLWLDEAGALHIETALGELVDDAPYIYQEIGGQTVEVLGKFELVDDDTYTFTVTSDYDPTVELIVDPDLAWSTYLGGFSDESGQGIAVDTSNNILVTGSTFSWGWVSGGFNEGLNGFWDAFVVKLAPTGNHLWSTYLGGSSYDWGHGIAVDALGNILVTGDTTSSDWVSGGFDTNLSESAAGFVAKLTPTGDPLWSTYLNGTWAMDVAVDASGNALVTGKRPTDAFVTKLSPDGGHLWSSYLGASSNEYGYGIAVDTVGNAVVTGYTSASGWVSGGFDMSFNGGPTDAFVVKLDPAGGHLWSTYLGGGGRDWGTDIAVDASDNIVVTDINGGAVTKLSPTGQHLWSTSVGGEGLGIAADAFGNVLVTGRTDDAFIAKLSQEGDHIWTTSFGGSNKDGGNDIVVDGAGNALATGYTYSADWVSDGWDTVFNGSEDAFVVKIGDAGVPQDVGDTLLQAQNLGPLTSGVSLTQQEQIGNGEYGAKDVDLYRFELATTGSVRIRVDTTESGSSLDGYLRLFDGYGRVIATSDDADNWDPYLSLSLAPGTYYVGVSGSPNRYYDPEEAGSGTPSNTTGNYQLRTALDGADTGTWEPLVTAAAEYDGDSAPGVFGRYLTGSVVDDVWNTFTAYVLAPTGYTTSAVTFDANFNGVRDAGDYTDSFLLDGWTWDLNVSDLNGDKTLSIWGQESGGAWSDATTFTIDTLAAPDWMDPELTDVSFNASAAKYEIESLIGKRFGVETPSDWPEWLAERDGKPTFNGLHLGILVEADCSLAGKVSTGRIAPAFGWALLGMSQTYVAPDDLGSHFEIEVDLFMFIDFWKNPLKFARLMASPAAGYYDSRNREDWFPKVGLAYDGKFQLGDDLEFSQYEMTFSASLSTLGPLFKLESPPVIFPLWAPPDISLVLTPHLGFSPSFQIEYGQNLDLATGDIEFDHVTAEIGMVGDLGVAGEIAVLGGLATGGVDVTGTIDVGFAVTYDGDWIYSIPAEIGIDIDFIGSVLWVFAGKIDVFEWSTGKFDLWTSGGSASAASMARAVATSSNGDYSISPMHHAIGRSETGGMAYAFVPVSLDGTAQSLAVQRQVGGVWQSVEVIADDDHHRGTPAIVSLGGDDWMVLWSQSNLATDKLSGLTGDQVVAEQELWYSVWTDSAWSTPTQATNDSVCDDSPALIRMDDGTVVAAWRRMAGTDVTDPSLSDIAYATWNGTSWSSIGTLADTSNALSQVSLAKLADDTIVATWTADVGISGSEVTVWAALFDGDSWSLPVELSNGESTVRTWSGVAALANGSAVAIWTEEDEAGVTLYYAQGDDGGNGWEWGAATAVMEPLAVLSNPQILADGNVVRVIYHTYGQENEIVGISRDFGDLASSWQSLELLTPESGQAGWAVAALDANGGVQLRYIRDLAEVSADVSAQPDLALDGTTLALTTDPPIPGESNSVCIQAANEGWAVSEATTVDLYDGDPTSGGVLITSATINTLGIGESADVSLSWTPLAGDHQLWLVVDGDGSVTESDETNNTYSQKVAVLEAPTIALDADSDTGILGDGRTVDSTPTFTGTAVNGVVVQVFVDNAEWPADTTGVSDELYELTVPELANGRHTISARVVNSEGYVSAFSAPIEIFIDAATLPSPGTPRLDEDSDTGIIGDGVTNVRRPEIVGTAKPLSDALLYDNSTFLGEATADSDGNFSFVPPEDLSPGLHEISVRQTDDSGNTSEESSSQIIIDDSTPTATLQPSTTAGGSDVSFSVVYSDNIAVLVSTIGTGNILVTGPNGYNQAAEIVNVDDSTDGTPRTATYRVLSPGNEWLKSDNGTYQISMVAD